MSFLHGVVHEALAAVNNAAQTVAIVAIVFMELLVALVADWVFVPPYVQYKHKVLLFRFHVCSCCRYFV